MRGRLLENRDGTSAPPVVLLNESAAERLFPAGDELGQQIAFWGARWTIVGVIGDEKLHGLTQTAPIAAYMPLAQAPSRGGGGALLVRTPGEPELLVSAVRGAIAEIDPALAIFGVEPLANTVTESIGTERFLMVLLVLFAALALVLVGIGIYGVLSYAVAQRTRELGIRLALGASPRTVMVLVMSQMARLTLCGLGAGLRLGVGFSRSLRGLLFGVSSTDPTTIRGCAHPARCGGDTGDVAAAAPRRADANVEQHDQQPRWGCYVAFLPRVIR